ncbi:MAG: hypothetical protein CMO55_17175 [Verrucomicrobiales bacterium]|nr:hypothetical protein [Verrucomicrobiales bacterium]
MPAPEFVIHTGKNGTLDTTTVEHIDLMMAAAKEKGRLVIHLHGGLVNEEKARAKADELLPVYQGTGCHPVFFIYETGLLEIVRNNVGEIAKEKIFKILLNKILQYAKGKLGTPEGAKGIGGFPLPSEIEIGVALSKVNQEIEPFPGFQTVTAEALTEQEEARFREELSTNVILQEEIQAVVNGAADFSRVEESSKGITVSHQVSTETLMSPDVVSELVEEARMKEGKGIFASAAFFLRAGKILSRVVSRFLEKRHHGLYTTVVEELLREFYLANVGASVWGAMKKETSDTFEQPGGEEKRGGWYFVERLGELLQDEGDLEVNIVAHSLGSVFACNLIDYLAMARASETHPLPENFQLRNLLFMAPAVSHERFAQTLSANADLFREFRMFNLGDELESGYWEVPGVYPRSLLYLVSGLFEVDGDGSGVYDKPLVGMARYLSLSDVYQSEGVPEIREFLEAGPDRVFYSIVDSGDGKATNAVKHGGFDDWDPPAPRKTMESVSEILSI